MEPVPNPGPQAHGRDPSQAAQAAFPQIPGYRIEAVIGRGSAGTVYRAVQLAIDRKVAIKVLHPELATRGRAVRRLQREARTTAKLSHPGIVTAIDMGTTGGLWWYAMELVEGPSLAEKLKSGGALAERDAIRLFIPLCEALEHAFEHGVVHRDIKPGNILIDGTGRARIVDLGLAFAEDDPALTLQGGTLGTPHYISPEQARNPKNADVKSDIWSLGATLYHCVCGRPPFSGNSVAEILSGVLYAPVPDPVEFSPELGKPLRLVIRKCLARDPARRYQHPRELREDLEAIRERRAVSVRRSTLEPVRGEREMRRRMLWSSLGIAAAAGLVALVALRPWAGSEGSEAASAPAPYPELERVAEIAANPRRIAHAIERLGKIARGVPPEHEARAAELRRELEARYEAALDALRSDLEGELSRRAAQRDFVGMLAWIDQTLPMRLRNELDASKNQIEEIGREFELAARRSAIERDLDEALHALYDRVGDHYAEQRVRRRSEPARAQGKWRTARAALEASGAELIAESGVAVAGFPPERVAAVAASLETGVVAEAVDELEKQWTVTDNQKSIELGKIRQDLLRGLEERRILEGVAELERRWREIVHYAEGEDLELGGATAAALAKARADLGEVETRVRAEDARSILTSLVADLEPAWSERKYDQIAEKLGEMLARPALEPVRADIELLLAEAKLLEDVLGRAAQRIEAAAASREELELFLGSLPRRGRIEEAFQPFVRGFRFRPSDSPSAGTILIALRELPSGQGHVSLLSRAGIEQLAGLGAVDPPERGLETALLRWRSGDRQAALDLRASLRPPADAELARLYAELRSRLERDERESRIATEERIAEATDFLRRIRRARQEPSATPREQAKWIDDLTRRFGDLAVVTEAEGELRERRAELLAEIARSDEEHLQATYGPTELEFKNPLVLRWVFDASYRGAFQIQGWKPDVEGGWIAPSARTRAEVASDRNWPVLYLREGIDLTKDLDFELHFEQPDDSGDPELLALSVAGVHVVFVAPAHFGQTGRYLVGSGTPDGDFADLLRDALDRGKGKTFDGFDKGKRYRVRIELRNGRGLVGVLVNGRELSRESSRKPDPSSYGDKTILIRSLEPVRILDATLRARAP